MKEEMNFIVGCTAMAYKMNAKDLYKRSRLRKICEPRQVAMYFMRMHGHKYVSIADHFNMNHSGVIHAENKIWGLMQCDKELDLIVQEVEKLIKGKWRKDKYYPKNIQYLCNPCIANPKVFTIFTK